MSTLIDIYYDTSHPDSVCMFHNPHSTAPARPTALTAARTYFRSHVPQNTQDLTATCRLLSSADVQYRAFESKNAYFTYMLRLTRDSALMVTVWHDLSSTRIPRTKFVFEQRQPFNSSKWIEEIAMQRFESNVRDICNKNNFDINKINTCDSYEEQERLRATYLSFMKEATALSAGWVQNGRCLCYRYFREGDSAINLLKRVDWAEIARQGITAPVYGPADVFERQQDLGPDPLDQLADTLGSYGMGQEPTHSWGYGPG